MGEFEKLKKLMKGSRKSWTIWMGIFAGLMDFLLIMSCIGVFSQGGDSFLENIGHIFSECFLLIILAVLLTWLTVHFAKSFTKVDKDIADVAETLDMTVERLAAKVDGMENLAPYIYVDDDHIVNFSEKTVISVYDILRTHISEERHRSGRHVTYKFYRLNAELSDTTTYPVCTTKVKDRSYEMKEILDRHIKYDIEF